MTQQHPEGNQKVGTDLILDDRVPDVLRKFAHRVYVRAILLLVSNRTSSLQNGLQLVLNPFKSPSMVLTRALTGDGSTKRTQIRSTFV